MVVRIGILPDSVRELLKETTALARHNDNHVHDLCHSGRSDKDHDAAATKN